MCSHPTCKLTSQHIDTLQNKFVNCLVCLTFVPEKAIELCACIFLVVVVLHLNTQLWSLALHLIHHQSFKLWERRGDWQSDCTVIQSIAGPVWAQELCNKLTSVVGLSVLEATGPISARVALVVSLFWVYCVALWIFYMLFMSSFVIYVNFLASKCNNFTFSLISIF